MVTVVSFYPKSIKQTSQFLHNSSEGTPPCKLPRLPSKFLLLLAVQLLWYMIHVQCCSTSWDVLLPKIYWVVEKQTAPQVHSGHNPTVLWDPPACPNLAMMGLPSTWSSRTPACGPLLRRKWPLWPRTPVWLAFSKEKRISKVIVWFPSNWKCALHLGPYHNGLNWHVELSHFPLKPESCLKVLWTQAWFKFSTSDLYVNTSSHSHATDNSLLQLLTLTFHCDATSDMRQSRIWLLANVKQIFLCSWIFNSEF